MEEARIAYLREIPELDFIGKTSFTQSVVLATISCDFLAPGKIGDVVVAAIGVSKVGRKSITMEYRMDAKSSGKTLAKGTSTLVMFDFAKNESMELPESIRARILEIEA